MTGAGPDRFGRPGSSPTVPGGSDRLLLYRHTPAKEDSYPLEKSLVFAGRIVEEGVDILDISPASDKAPADLAQPFHQFGAPVIGVGQMDEAQRAVEALTEGRADLIALGRGLIADPLWPKRVQGQRFDGIVSCVRCNEKCYGHVGKGIPIECSQW